MKHTALSVVLFASAAFGLAATGCSNESSGDDGTGAAGPVPKTADGCVIATGGSFRYSAGANSGWFTASWGTALEPSLGEGWQALQIKLTERGAEAKPGTYDLSKEGLSTGECDHCVYVAYQGSGDHFQLDLATSGTLVIEEIDMDRGILRGSLSDVRFQHLVETGLHHFEGLADDNHCVSLAAAAIDTRPVPGGQCFSAEDCPNAKLQVCDPKSGQCADVACTADAPTCPGTDVCVIQDVQQGTGACFQSCTPFSSGSCPSGQDCVVNDYVGAQGICKRQGPESPAPETVLKPDRTCEPRQIATGCGPGHVCTTDAVYWHYDHCYEQCDYFAETPSCAGGRCYMFPHSTTELSETWLCGVGDCHFGGFCVEAEDDIGFGQPCAEGQDYCRGDDLRSGMCLPDSGGAIGCRRLCRLAGNDCDAGETCQQVQIPAENEEPRVIAGLGYCAP